MLYDAYVVKMKRLVKLRNAIIKYRFLILATMFLTLVGVSTFLFSIGKISITTDCQEEIVYGETLDFKAKAFLKDVTYEYKSGSSWTNVFPTNPGNHEVRAVSKGLFGKTKYSKSQDFIIKPKDVVLTVNGYNYSYGDEITLSGNLVSGDTAKIMGFTTKLTDVGKTTINSSNTIIKIFNRQGIDVTKCYNITFNETDVSINKRPIIIDIMDAEKVYDGTPLTSDTYEITSGSFVYDDKLNIQFSSSITDVTSISNIPTVYVTDVNGNDVTHFYNIKINAGNLKITKATVNITTGSSKFEYDGTNHEVLDYTIDSDFNTKFKGFTIEVLSDVLIREVGTHDNELSFIIRNAQGIDVTSFFNLKITYGKVEITKRNLQVVTGSTSMMYTGSNIEHKIITSSTGLLPNHTCEVLSDTNPNKINVGKYDNKLSVKIVDETGNNVTGNYNITYTYGIVEVTKRPITVESLSNTYIYNGSNIYHKDFKVTSSNGLADTDSAAIATYTEILNVGSIENKITIKIYKTLDPTIDCTDNYDIQYVYGTITVSKRPIIVQTGTTEHIYDDKNYSYASWDVIGEYKFCHGHVATPLNVPTIKYVGSIENKFSIDILDHKGELVTSNYEIEYVYGTVTVVPRPIVIKTQDIEKEYDNTPLTDQTHELKEKPDLVDGHTFTYGGPYAEITNVSETSNTLLITDIFDITGQSVINNYDIQYEYGKLKIYPRTITIESLSASKIYDGQILTYPKTVEDGKLLPGHKYICDGFVTVTDVGEYPNEFQDVYIYNEYDVDITYNYEVTKVFGTLTITKRQIVLESKSAEKVYDGYDIYNREYEIISGTLVTGHNLEVTESTHFKGAVSAHNVFDEYLITDSIGNDITYNYDIKQGRMGLLTITPRNITFQTASNEFQYDGLEHCDPSYTIISSDGLAETDTIIKTLPTYVKEVGVYVNVVEYEIDNYINDYGTVNYNITYQYGKLEVYTNKVTIKPVDKTITYNGYYQSADEYECLIGKICDNHEAVITFGGTIKNVGTVITTIDDIKVYDNGVDVTNNYEFTIENGSLEITPLEITITSIDLVKAYDGTPLTSVDATYSIDKSLSGFTLDVIPQYAEITEVGIIEYQHQVNKIYDPDNEDGTSNFIINYKKGTLEIKPREITIKTGNFEKVYDGTPLNAIDFDLVQEVKLNAGDMINWSSSYGTITNVGEVENKLVVETIVDEFGNDVTSNYLIKYQYGTLKITPQILTILTGSSEKVYDDTPLYCDTYEILNGTLIGSDYLTITNSSYALYYSEKPIQNILTFKVIDGETGYNSNNYQLVCQYGTLQILKRPLEVSTPDLSVIYTSKIVENLEYTIINPENIVVGQTHGAHREEELINVGTYNNQLVVDIYNVDNINVGYCYDITYYEGTLVINPREIEFITGSAEKEYDGKPLFSEDYSAVSSYPEPDNYAIGENDKIVITEHTEIVHVGTADNILTFKIVNKKGEETTTNYSITITTGILKITGSEHLTDEPDAVITFDTTSKRTYFSSYDKQVWEENGITVTNSVTSSSSYLYSYVNPVRFYTYQKVKVEYEEIKKAIIYTDNNPYGNLTIDGAEVQRNGRVFTIFFDEVVTEFEISSLPFRMDVIKIELFKGEKQEEVPEEDEPDDKNFEDIFNTSGDLNGSVSEGEGQQLIVFKFTTNQSGHVYFRLKSFGDYVPGSGFSEAPGFDFSSYEFNPIYLTSKILEENGYYTNDISIVIEIDKTPYLLPYFGTNYNTEGTDSILDLAYSGSYSLDYIDFNILNSDFDFVNSLYAEYELAYRTYVYNNYLDVPSSLESTLNKHIGLAGIDPTSPSVIADVVNYIKNLKPYDLKAEYPTGVDDVLYFLETAEGGVCRHFAAAATMMFRQLGIAARYTIGFVAYAKAEDQISVFANQYHGWVEIYIDGLGWVIVDPTGDGGPQTPNPDEEEPIEKIPLTIKPLDRVKQYDGLPLYPYNFDDINTEGITQLIEGVDETSQILLQELLAEGYTYDIIIDGSQTNVGESDSIISSFIFYNPAGVDVTENFIFTFEPGKLRVVNQLIEIRFYNQIKYYSGNEYSYTPDMVYEIIGLPDDYSSFTFDIVGTIINAGNLKAQIDNIVLLDQYGNDISSNYEFSCVGKIEVRQKILIVRTQSASKKYNGEELTNHNWWIRLGDLIDGDKMTVEMTSAITNIGHIENAIDSYEIKNSKGEDVTLNYKVIVETGILEVTE